MAATLDSLRRALEALADGTGEYRLVCARHGDEPVPATGLRFERRADARGAARIVEQYRRQLREYDPELRVYDIVVSQVRDNLRREPRAEPPTSEHRAEVSQRHD